MESRFMRAALIGMTIDRNTVISSTNDKRITSPITIGSRLDR